MPLDKIRWWHWGGFLCVVWWLGHTLRSSEHGLDFIFREWVSLTDFMVGMNCSAGPARRKAFPNSEFESSVDSNYFKNPPYQLKEEEKDQRGSKDFSYDQNKFQRRKTRKHMKLKKLFHKTDYCPVYSMKILSFLVQVSLHYDWFSVSVDSAVQYIYIRICLPTQSNNLDIICAVSFTWRNYCQAQVKVLSPKSHVQ